MNDNEDSLLNSLDFLTSQIALAQEKQSEFIEISNWPSENKICKQGIVQTNPLPATLNYWLRLFKKSESFLSILAVTFLSC